MKLALALAVGTLALASTASGQARPLDDFDRQIRWTVHPSDGTTMTIRADAGRRGRSLRIDYAFSGGGYAIVRREIPLDLPENYEFSFWIRGDSPIQNLEFKLVDSTGDNVWWRNQRDFAFPRTWKRASIKRRQVEFAWGPAGANVPLRRVKAIEIAITARSGGRGTVWLDDLVLEARPPASATPLAMRATASSTAREAAAARAIDRDSTTMWESAPGDTSRWIALDFGGARELGGLTIQWRADRHPADYDVQIADDSATWRTVYAARASDGGRDFIYLPETETRKLRIVARSPTPASISIREITVQPIEWSASRNAFFTAIAARAPRGEMPRYFLGQQSYWTIIGVNGDMREALLNDQGALEPDKRSFSIEPFVAVDGKLFSWADVTKEVSLDGGYLPIPSVAWRAADLALTITAFASGTPGRSVLWARYRVENQAKVAKSANLYLTVRPFQVNPPAQFLNTAGGATEIRSLAFDGKVVRVLGEAGEQARTIIPVTRPTDFGATTFDAGGVVAGLRRGRLPAARRAADSLGATSGALSYALQIEPGMSIDVWLAIPWYPSAVAGLLADTTGFAGDSALAATRREWTAALDRVHIELPPQGTRFVESLKANIAWMLITRDGPALQPGARSYERAWIRDGAMMATALLRLGRDDEARRFADWYVNFQYPNGKVPCCVDARGADPVPENDSHGQLIYLAAEVYRYTGDKAFLTRMWPHVVKAVAYIDSLRHSRMTAAYAAPDKRAYWGLLPQSISHEGYSAKPMHSYWDDLFTLRGLKDATDIAQALGREPERARFAQIRDEFRRDLMASYRSAMAMHKIDYLPGAVEVGDFDATSTTVGVAPGGEIDSLPHPALERTFEKYYENFRARRDSTWDAYTPYELRVVGTMVRLGWKDRAHELLDFFFNDQRPAAWRAWAEVVYRDTAATRFIGDLPHAWVGSDYIRSALDMLAYDRESDSSLVIGAGISSSWASIAPGVVVRGLRTPYGALDFTVRAMGDTVRVNIDAARVPPGGFVIRSPLSSPLRAAYVNGNPIALPPTGDVRVRDATARLILFHSAVPR